MTTYALVEEVKKQGVYTTDNQVADALGVNRANVSMWKKKGVIPKGDISLMLADLAKKSPAEAYRIMQSGYASLSLLMVTSVFMSLIILNNISFLERFIHYAK